MFRFFGALTALALLQGCGSSGGAVQSEGPIVEGPIDVVENGNAPVQLATIERRSGGILIRDGDIEIDWLTEGAYEDAQAVFPRRSYFGGHGNFWGWAVATETENVIVAATVHEPITDAYFDNITVGIAGLTAPPPDRATAYVGQWALVEVGHITDPLFPTGDLNLIYSFADNSVTGAGTIDSTGPDVFFVDGTAALNGTITGTVRFDGQSADLNGGFFGDDAAELAGSFIGDDFGGVIVSSKE